MQYIEDITESLFTGNANTNNSDSENSDYEDDYTENQKYDLITPYKNLYNKDSFIINGDRNNRDNVDFRIDNYFINDILDSEDI